MSQTIMSIQNNIGTQGEDLCTIMFKPPEEFSTDRSKVVVLMLLDFQNQYIVIEPSHEIMVLFVFRKLILQTLMRSHPVGLRSDFWLDPSSISILDVCEQRMVWRASLA